MVKIRGVHVATIVSTFEYEESDEYLNLEEAKENINKMSDAYAEAIANLVDNDYIKTEVVTVYMDVRREND